MRINRLKHRLERFSAAVGTESYCSMFAGRGWRQRRLPAAAMLSIVQFNVLNISNSVNIRAFCPGRCVLPSSSLTRLPTRFSLGKYERLLECDDLAKPP